MGWWLAGGGLGSWVQGDFFAGEVFELVDEGALTACGVGSGVVDVGVEVVVAGLGVGGRCQMMVSTEFPAATMARLVPRRLLSRR